MRLQILTLAAAASATASNIARQDSMTLYPVVQILPIPGYQAGADAFNALASLYADSASKLSAQADAIAGTNAALNGSGGLQYKYDAKVSLYSALSTVSNTAWQTAYDTEKKVCSIVTSINQQNVNTVRGNLRAGIYAEAQAIVKITLTILATIDAIKAQVSLFADSEKAVVTGLVAAITAALTAGIEPATTLSAGLTASGTSAINDVVQALQQAVATIQAAATINWATS